jgi:hypothetical protein
MVTSAPDEFDNVQQQAKGTTMFKRMLFAIVAVFVAWQVMDVILHGVILMKTYEATASLWRPMNEMKGGLMRLVGAVASVAFVAIYATMIRPKSAAAGLIYGTLFGLGTGFSMGIGSYCYMPIPLSLAVAWFLGSVVECAVAGLLAGWIVKEPDEAAEMAVATPK